MKKITVYCEENNDFILDASYELISKAYELAIQAKSLNGEDYEVEAVVISSELNSSSIKKAAAAGASKIIHLKNENFSLFNQMLFSRVFVDYFNQSETDVLLFPATEWGRMVAPRVTTALNCGLVADCTGLEFILKDKKLLLASTRPTFGAELMATILSKTKPECATVRPSTFAANFSRNAKAQYLEFECSSHYSGDLRLITSEIEQKSEAKDFLKAQVVFAAGFGLYEGKESEYVKKLEQVAKKLKAGFAASRKLVDFGIVDSTYQIGQTGASIAPKLYVAFGISGAIQHIQGMKNSDKIIGINTDENADIFKYCDYKIVADARDVIDDLAKACGV